MRCNLLILNSLQDFTWISTALHRRRKIHDQMLKGPRKPSWISVKYVEISGKHSVDKKLFPFQFQIEKIQYAGLFFS